MRPLGRQRRKLVALLAVAAAAAAIGTVAYATNLLRHSEQQALDARFSLRGTRAAPPGVLLVQIDDRTLQELRNRRMASEFPFPRRYDATVIDRLRAAGAKVIALDIEFSQRNRPCRRQRAGRSDRSRARQGRARHDRSRAPRPEPDSSAATACPRSSACASARCC